jgi:hypothetical protein
VARFDTVAIGNELIRDPKLRMQDYVADMARSRQEPPDLILGADFLKTHRVFVSRSQDKVYFSYTGGQVFSGAPALDCDTRQAGKSPQEALAAYDAAIAANPGDTKALVQRASLRRREGDLPGALADLDAVIKAEANNAVALAMRSSVRAQRKDFDGAMADSDAAIANGMRTAALYVSRGRIRRAQGDCVRAIVEYDEALKIDPMHQGAAREREACRDGGAKKGA